MKLHIRLKGIEKTYCGKNELETYQHENVIRPKNESELIYLIGNNIINALVLCRNCEKKMPKPIQAKINNIILQKQIEEMQH